MKITSIRVTHVNVPFDAPFWWTAGLYPGASKSIVEVETDYGIVGLGEAPWWHFGEVIEREIAPALIGADPFDLADCEVPACLPIRSPRTPARLPRWSLSAPSNWHFGTSWA